MALMLKSRTFDNGAAIPARYTCKGDDVSPPLNWAGVTKAARSLVLIVDDPDAKVCLNAQGLACNPSLKEDF